MLQLSARPVWYTGQQAHIFKASHTSGHSQHHHNLLFSNPELSHDLLKQKDNFHSESNVVFGLAHVRMMLLLCHSYSKLLLFTHSTLTYSSSLR